MNQMNPSLGPRISAETLYVLPADTGDAREVVDLAPPLVAEWLELADPAVLVRVRLSDVVACNEFDQA